MAAHKTHLTYDDVVATLPHLDPEEQLNLLELEKGLARTYGRRWT